MNKVQDYLVPAVVSKYLGTRLSFQHYSVPTLILDRGNDASGQMLAVGLDLHL